MLVTISPVDAGQICTGFISVFLIQEPFSYLVDLLREKNIAVLSDWLIRELPIKINPNKWVNWISDSLAMALPAQVHFM